MAYSRQIKEAVITLRKSGVSLNELNKKFGVSKGVLSLWLRDIKLSKKAEKQLLTKIKKGQYIGGMVRREKIKSLEKEYFNKALEDLKKLVITKEYARLLCVAMYWCEGTKDPKNGMTFINSDPDVIKKFLGLLRVSFVIDESKFHPCIHLHSYHNINKQIDFWSKITHIDKKQFIKPYIKPNTGKRIRDNYPGCISIKYHSNDLARQLLAIGKAFLKGV